MTSKEVVSKFTKGKQINSLLELVDLLQRGFWVYWESSPKHPSILWHMQLSTLRAAVTTGILYIAEKELP